MNMTTEAKPLSDVQIELRRVGVVAMRLADNRPEFAERMRDFQKVLGHADEEIASLRSERDKLAEEVKDGETAIQFNVDAVSQLQLQLADRDRIIEELKRQNERVLFAHHAVHNLEATLEDPSMNCHACTELAKNDDLFRTADVKTEKEDDS